MRTIIIIGDGDSHSTDRNLQAIEFWNYGMAIANWCQELGSSYSIYAPQRVWERVAQGQPNRAQDEQKASPAPAAVTAFASAQTVVSALRSLNEMPLIVCIGHGFTIVNGGAVELCSGNTAADKQIASGDIDGLTRCVYLGLHCHAQSFADGVNGTKPVFYLTGRDVGQNSDIAIFAENCKTSFNALALHLGLYEDGDKSAAAEAIDALKQMAITVNETNGKGVAGQKNKL